MRTVTLPDGSTRTRLETWGEIASHLGVEVRTAQRWERRMGIPIRRLEGGQAVFAFVDELDAWLDKKQVPPLATPASSMPPALPSPALAASQLPDADPQAGESTTPARLPIASIVVTAVAVFGGLLLVVSAFFANNSRAQPAREPVSLALEGNQLVARDATGDTLWVHRFQPGVVAKMMTLRSDQSWWERLDTDGDGVDELVAIVGHPTREQEATEALYCFSLDGSLRYSYLPEFTMAFEQGNYSGPWRIWDIEPVPEDHSLWVALESYRWWPSVVVRVDAQGTASQRYAQPGLIRRLKSVKDGDRIQMLAGGVNNEYGSASLAVFDIQGPPSTAPQKRSGPYICKNCPLGKPLKYFLLPPSPLNLLHGLPYNQLISIETNSSGLQLGTLEVEAISPGPAAVMFYRLAKNLDVTAAAPSDAYWSWKPANGARWSGHDAHPRTLPTQSWQDGRWFTNEVAVVGLHAGTK
jgi:hypothetical protein